MQAPNLISKFREGATYMVKSSELDYVVGYSIDCVTHCPLLFYNSHRRDKISEQQASAHPSVVCLNEERISESGVSLDWLFLYTVDSVIGAL